MKPATEKELAAIDAVKSAIKDLPLGIFIEIDTFNKTLEFWKRESPILAYRIGKPMRCKHALSLN